jgi:hypothetical protein
MKYTEGRAGNVARQGIENHTGFWCGNLLYKDHVKSERSIQNLRWGLCTQFAGMELAPDRVQRRTLEIMVLVELNLWVSNKEIVLRRTLLKWHTFGRYRHMLSICKRVFSVWEI